MLCGSPQSKTEQCYRTRHNAKLQAGLQRDKVQPQAVLQRDTMSSVSLCCSEKHNVQEQTVLQKHNIQPEAVLQRDTESIRRLCYRDTISSLRLCYRKTLIPVISSALCLYLGLQGLIESCVIMKNKQTKNQDILLLSAEVWILQNK